MNREEILQLRGIAPTAMRLLVLDELKKADTAISLADLETSMERADKVTIYRTLKTFEKHKLVHSIDDGSGSVKYALCAAECECRPQDVHAHFHCNHCNGTYCLTEYHLPQIQLPEKFLLKGISMVFNGLCDRCAGL
ncbi:transcriptional repressor [Ravibacter arvi]|uniref:Transcriptional repressor n=1 Tax=Ravibacter arvi TaxID=2051041 RepID=A0ABP8LQ79_9BACT